MSTQTLSSADPVRILVVDDDRLSRRVIAANLAGSAYDVREAVNGQHALEIAAAWAPDLVLLDALMPVMDGYTCCERLRAMPELKDCLILMLTGVDEDASIDRAFAVGASDYITKPVRPRALRNRIGYLVRAQQIEQRVRRSKREWEATFDAVADLIVLVDEDGLIIRCNRAAADRLGGSYAALIGRRLSDQLGITPDHAVWAQPDAVGDMQFPGLDGWHRMYAYDMPAGVDTVRRVYVLRNVTARKQAEERLRASEAQQRALLQAIPDALFVLDRQGRLVLVDADKRLNDRHPALTDLVGCNALELVPPELQAQAVETFDRALATRQVQLLEVPIAHTGALVWYECRMVVADADRLVVVVRDITQRKNDDEKLRASEARQRAILRAIPDTLLIQDRTGRYVEFHDNPREGALIRPESILGRMPEDLTAPGEELERYRASFERAFATGQFQLHESHVDLGETQLYYEQRMIPIDDQQMLAVVRDITERKHSEERLRASEARQRALLQALPDIIFMLDSEGRIIDFHSNATESLPVPPEQFMGQPYLMFVPADQARHYIDGIALAKASGQVTTVEVEAYGAYYENRLVAMGDRILSVVRDVTERKRSEDRLRASEARQRALLQALPDLLFVQDREGRFVDFHFNQASDLLLPPEQFMGRLASEVTPVDLYPELEYHLERAWQSSSVVTFEMPVTLPNGKGQFLEYRMMKAGEDRMLTVVRNITDRRQAEEDLRASQAEFRSLFEEAPVMYLRLRHEGDDPIIVQANRAFLDGLGYRREEVLGRPLERFYTEESIRGLLEVGVRISSREPFTAERQLLTKEGQVIDTVLKTVPERDRTGVVTGTRAMFTDVTALKQLQRQIESSQKLADLGTLAAGVAHEMNSPLQVITGMSQSLLRTLERDSLTPERLKSSLEMINRNAWRCAEISRALRTYAHSSGGALQPYSLSDLVKDALLLTEHQLRAWSNIEVATDLAESLPEVACDRNQIAQVVINLLTNARDAMPDGGQIHIRTYAQEDGQVALSVRDTGEGIPESIRSKIFNPFFTTKAVGTGTGLGLSIIDGIVKAHGGRIELTSMVHSGTTFVITFPAYELAPAVHVETLPVEVKGRFDEGTVVSGRPTRYLSDEL